MIVIGIIGNIGSGKSYVAKQFKYPVFNADLEVKKIYKKDRLCFNKLKKILPKYISALPIKKSEIKKKLNKEKLNILADAAKYDVAASNAICVEMARRENGRRASARDAIKRMLSASPCARWLTAATRSASTVRRTSRSPYQRTVHVQAQLSWAV